MQIAQIILGAGATRIVPQQSSPVSNHNTNFQILILQNNTSDVMRVGDSTVTAARGIQLGAGGTLTINLGLEYSSDLGEYYVIGTAGDLLDIMYVG